MQNLKLLQASNPFQIVLDNLSTAPEPLSLQTLDWIADILAEFNFNCVNYGEVIQFLEFMEEHNLLKMEKSSKTGVYTICKLEDRGGS